MSERDGLIECYKTCGYYCDRSVVFNTSGRTGIVAGGGSCPYVHLVSARKEIEELKAKVEELQKRALPTQSG